jgi:hypothetical protein
MGPDIVMIWRGFIGPGFIGTAHLGQGGGGKISPARRGCLVVGSALGYLGARTSDQRGEVCFEEGFDVASGRKGAGLRKQCGEFFGCVVRRGLLGGFDLDNFGG